MSNPANTLPPHYDDSLPQNYDPGFTADISSKMRIPHRLSAVNGYADEAPPRAKVESSNQRSVPMSVPERILVAGSDQHIGVKPGPNLNLDLVPGQDYYVGLETPPRTLTLEERGFPLTGDETEERNMQKQLDESMNIMNGSITATPPRNHSNPHLVATPTTPGDALLLSHEEDDLLVLRRQVSKMSRKVAYLEQENDRRSQREMVLYPMVIGYLLFRMAAWLLRNN